MASEDAPVQITADPKAGQRVEHDGKASTTIKEGLAYILVPPNARTSVDPQAKSKPDAGTQAQNVFYNPIQQFNRDLSVLAIKALGEDICQRKTHWHDLQQKKNQRKKDRKRKRIEVQEDNGEGEEGGSKLRKGENGSPVAAENDTTVAGAEQHGMDLGTREDGGVAVLQDQDHGSSSVVDADAALAEERTDEPNGETATSSKNEPGPDEPQRTWQPRFRILDALSATGLRALRYASEIPFVTGVVANDREKNAVKSINLNVEHNKLGSAISTITGDALAHMYGVAFPPTHSHGPHHISGKYDVIDLDPYGTAAPFIDAALQALEDGGLLCVTCTDSGVFASCGYSEKTFALYGGMPIKGLHSHEGGLRLILHSVATNAAKYGISIEPLLSLSIDFYVRLFIRVRKSAQDVKFVAGKSMLVYGCDHGCGAWTTQHIGRHTRHKNSDANWKYSIGLAPSADQLCEHCGSKTHIAGPMWGGPLHNPAFIEKILDDLKEADPEVYQTKQRIEGMLETALDELSVNADTMDLRSFTAESKDGTKEIVPRTPPEAIDHHPFFFIPSALCKVIKAQAPPESMIKGALRHAGYRVTRSHCKAGSIKTDAPWTVIWEVFREWVRQMSPVKEGAVSEGQPGWKILQATRKPETNGESAADEIVEGHNEDASDRATDAANGTSSEDLAVNAKRLNVIFDEKLGKDKPGKRLLRYQQNPRENWGPMARAKGSG